MHGRSGGPGSGFHWTDDVRSAFGNMMLMGTGTFTSFYGIDQMSDWQKADFVNRSGIGTRSVLSPIYEVASGRIVLDHATETHVWRGEKNIVGYEWAPAEKQGGGGVVLNFTKDYNEGYAVENGWKVINGTDLASALAGLQAYKATGKKITNLVIHSHGTHDGSQLHLGSSNLDYSYYRWKKTNPLVALMNQLLAEVEPNSTVVFTGCNAARLLGPAMAMNIRCDINAYMNSNLTYGPDGSSGTSFWFNTTRIGGPRPNWMNLQTGVNGKVISIGPTGIKQIK